MKGIHKSSNIETTATTQRMITGTLCTNKFVVDKMLRIKMVFPVINVT